MKFVVTEFTNVIFLITNIANTYLTCDYDNKAMCTASNGKMIAVGKEHKGEKRKLCDDNKKKAVNDSVTYVPKLFEKNNNTEKIMVGGETLVISNTFINDVMYDTVKNDDNTTSNYINYKAKKKQPCNSTALLIDTSPSIENHVEAPGYITKCSKQTSLSLDNRQTEKCPHEFAVVDAPLNCTTTISFNSCYSLDSTQGDPSISIFFHTTVKLLKNVLYYRFNIAKFFNILNKKINKKAYPVLKEQLIKEFIAQSIQFSENNASNEESDTGVIDENEYKQIKHYEQWLINEVKNTKKLVELQVCKEFKAIKTHNKNYLISMNKVANNCGFINFHKFLHPFFKSIPITKYFCMIQNLVLSIYDMNSIVDEKCNQQLLNHLIEMGAFDVHECYCSIGVKTPFLFHWVVCWFFYFTSVCILPDCCSNEAFTCFCIDNYPQEFFIQFILIVHTVINLHDTVSIKKYDLSFILLFKQTIHELLFLPVNGGLKSIFKTNLQKLFKVISDIANHKIYHNYSIFNIRIIQTPKENFTLSNTLIPEVQKLVDAIFSLTRKSYEKALQRSGDLSKIK